MSSLWHVVTAAKRTQRPDRQLSRTLAPATVQSGAQASPGRPSLPSPPALWFQPLKSIPEGPCKPPRATSKLQRQNEAREANGLARGHPARASWPQAGPGLTCLALKCHIRLLLVTAGRGAVPTPRSRPTPRAFGDPFPFHACPQVDRDDAP